jgi:hypothetical protein
LFHISILEVSCLAAPFRLTWFARLLNKPLFIAHTAKERAMAASAVLQPDSSYFFQQLARVRHGVLVLDYDDRIASLCLSRDQRYFRPTLLEILDSILTTTCTRVILLSTQRLFDFLRTLGLQRHPEIWEPQRLSARGMTNHRSARNPRPPNVVQLGGEAPIAWLMKCPGDRNHTPQSAWGMLVRPEFYTERTGVVVGAPESLLQFLIDWLRTCGGEVC